MMNSSINLLLLLIAAVAGIPTVDAQSGGTPACVSNLIPCANYLGTTSAPPQSCCGPLKTAVTTQIDCLCGLYNTPGLLESFNINITQALDLPKRCGIDGASLSACSKVSVAAPAPAVSSTLAPTGTQGKDENGVKRMTGLGVSGLVFMASWVLILLC